MPSHSSWAFLKRSSPCLFRICRAQRQGPYHHLCVFSSTAAATSDRDTGQFLKVVIGVVLSGSALGLWFLASSLPFSRTYGLGDINQKEELSAADTLSVEKKKKTRYIFGDAYRRRVFFKYEKRIRLRSSPEKVFEYFSSHRTPEGEVFMTPADLMRAVVPVFPPSESNIVRDGYLRGEHQPGDLYCSPSKFFMLFDTNGDGLISFSEYIFLVTLLSIPEASFSVAFKMFDIDNNGEIEREEFKKVMALMRSYNRQGSSHRDGLRTGLRVDKSIENGGLIEYFFGIDGTGSLQHEKFVEFLRELHHEMTRLEFSHYDHKATEMISAKDFALSMVASSEISHTNKLLDRVDQLDDDPQLRDIRFTFEEFKNFAELRSKLQPLAFAIFSYGKVNGLLTKADFQRAASHVCGISVTNNVVDIVFHIFDANEDGSLSFDEFLNALERRERDIRQPMSTGIMELVPYWSNNEKSSLFTEIIP